MSERKIPPEAYHEEWHEALAEFVDPWIAKGHKEERAAIVAYLRNLPPMRGIPNMRHGAAFSDEIERGDHLRGTGD